MKPIRFTYILLTLGLSILLICCGPEEGEEEEYDDYTPPVFSVTPVTTESIVTLRDAPVTFELSIFICLYRIVKKLLYLIYLFNKLKFI